MGVIDRIRAYFYHKSLPTKSVRHSAKPVANMEQAKSISFLFDATDVDHRNMVLRYADTLKKKGKNIHLLGFIPVVDKEATFPFTFFTQKEIDWAMRPKGESVQQFTQQGVDVLVNLFPVSTPTLEAICLQTPANLKIGPVSIHPDACDLMVEMPAKAHPAQILQQIEKVLEKTMPQLVV
ncbi:MAG: hypothetical protein R2795_22450 [Saprospiraceae bacterium]